MEEEEEEEGASKQCQTQTKRIAPLYFCLLYFFTYTYKNSKLKTEIICSKLLCGNTHVCMIPPSFRLGLIAILRFLLHVSYTRKRGGDSSSSSFFSLPLPDDVREEKRNHCR